MARTLNRLLLIGLVVSILLSVDFLSALGAEEYHYIEETGSEAKRILYRLEEAGRVAVSSEKLNETFFNLCLHSGETLAWKITKPDMDASARIEGRTIYLTGHYKGKAVDRAFPIDDNPWYQPLSYSLRGFLRSEDPSVVFWMLRPDNLKLVKLKATKKGIEEMAVSGNQVKAHRVKVRCHGLLSVFWSGTYWYRVSDLLFVQYRGVHGLPGTPETVVRLVKDTCTDTETSINKFNNTVL